MTAVLDRVEISREGIRERIFSYAPPKTERYNRHDIWMVEMREGRGSEQVGNRPLLICQNQLGNKHAPTVIGVPLTTSLTKAKLPTHVYISASCGLEEDSVALFEQLVTLDKTRLKYKICSLDEKTSRAADKASMISLGLPVALLGL